jgi:hypothetical protein
MWHYESLFGGAPKAKVQLDMSNIIDMANPDRPFNVSQLIEALEKHCYHHVAFRSEASKRENGRKECKQRHVSSREQAKRDKASGAIVSEGLTSKPKPESSPDWFVSLGCQGVGCQTLILVGGFFEWERRRVDCLTTPRYCANVSSDVYIWTKADPSLQKSKNSKLHLFKLHGQCTHEYDPVKDVGLPYSNLRGSN